MKKSHARASKVSLLYKVAQEASGKTGERESLYEACTDIVEVKGGIVLRATNNELVAFWCDWENLVRAGYGATGTESNLIADCNLESKKTESLLMVVKEPEHAKRIKTVLQGRSYMNIDVQYGEGPDGFGVYVSTERAGTTQTDLLGMVANILAHKLKS